MALAVLAAFGFSFKAIFVKLAYPYGVDPIALLFLRMIYASPIFLWVAFATREMSPLSWRDWMGVVALGLVGYYGASIFDFYGLQYISAGLERLILFTYPMLTLLISLAQARRPATRREILSLIFSYAGIALVFHHDLGRAAETGRIWLGAGLVFASAVCYALYLSGSAALIARLGAARFAALATLISTIAVLLHFLHEHPVAIMARLPWQVHASGIAMGLFCTALPVFAQAMATQRLGASKVALVSMLGPLVTLFFAAWLLAEPLSLMQLLGALSVIGGVALITAPSRREVRAPSA
ncbi:MAG: DMT family transporter [Rhodocyclaceae bacterium]|nr:DMT family transporter [Rhodocyclaceae bacterium]